MGYHTSPGLIHHRELGGVLQINIRDLIVVVKTSKDKLNRFQHMGYEVIPLHTLPHLVAQLATEHLNL